MHKQDAFAWHYAANNINENIIPFLIVKATTDHNYTVKWRQLKYSIMHVHSNSFWSTEDPSPWHHCCPLANIQATTFKIIRICNIIIASLSIQKIFTELQWKKKTKAVIKHKTHLKELSL